VQGSGSRGLHLVTPQTKRRNRFHILLIAPAAAPADRLSNIYLP
jgi:hypothetical protein